MPDDEIEAHERGIRNALDAGYAVLERGGTSVEAVEAAVVVMEDDETFVVPSRVSRAPPVSAMLRMSGNWPGKPNVCPATTL